MTDTPTLSGRDLGQAERATRAVLDRVLAHAQTTFDQWAALNLLRTAPAPRPALVTGLRDFLKVSERDAVAAVDALVAGGLAIEVDGDVQLSAAGEARFRDIQREVDAIAERLYRDIPTADLQAAYRVLTVLTERANLELAGTAG